MVGGNRLVSGITRGTSTDLSGPVAGGSISSIVATAVSTVVRTITRNGGIALINFNSFRPHRHGRHRNHGPGANSAVIVPTAAIPTFSTNGLFGRGITGWAYYHYVQHLFSSPLQAKSTDLDRGSSKRLPQFFFGGSLFGSPLYGRS